MQATLRVLIHKLLENVQHKIIVSENFENHESFLRITSPIHTGQEVQKISCYSPFELWTFKGFAQNPQWLLFHAACHIFPHSTPSHTYAPPPPPPHHQVDLYDLLAAFCRAMIEWERGRVESGLAAGGPLSTLHSTHSLLYTCCTMYCTLYIYFVQCTTWSLK
jgi:hypothetical protein